MRARIQYGMEEKRMARFSRPLSISSRLIMGTLPFLVSFLKYDRTTLAAVGFRIAGPFLARRVWGFFSKT